MKVSSVCVYCGSSEGNDPGFYEAADQFGRILAKNGVHLVYGGGNVGLMGALARAAIEEGGEVTGIIPDFLTKSEIPLCAVHDLIVTDSMHTRKRIMFERSQAFVALPGGIGTLEELIEMLTWAQLGRHNHPIVLANLQGFWNPLIQLLDHMIARQFAGSNIRRFYGVVDKVDDILPRIEAAF